MKRALSLLLVLWMAGQGAALAQDSAAAALERRDAEERYRILTARLQEIADGQDVIMRRQTQIEQRLSDLAAQLERVKDDQGRTSTLHATREEVSRLAADLKEVDRKRVADNDRIIKGLSDLSKMPAPAPSAPVDHKPAPERSAIVDGPYREHTVKSGETLGAIMIIYNQMYEENGQAPVTSKQIEEMNPGLKPNSIRVGQVIKIPEPPKKKK